MPNLVNDPAHWAERAEQMRGLADQTKDDGWKQAMLRVASNYDKLAARATVRSDGRRIPISGTPANSN
jgi:hypothetical protein